MIPTLILLATIIVLFVVAVVLLLWADRQSSRSAFGTSGHLSSEFKVFAVVAFTIIVGLWTGLFALSTVTSEPAVTVLDIVTGYSKTATISLAAVASAYILGRSVVKAAKCKHNR